MGTKLKSTNLVNITTTGVQVPDFSKAPEGGFTATARISGGSATVQLRGWVDPLAKEILGTITLPVASGSKAGDLFDTIVVLATYDNIDFNVTAIAGGASLDLSIVGVGV